MSDRVTITTTEMHTGGEPVRIVESGYPQVEGATILAKRRYAREHLDHLRTMLMAEPRGHADMYGVIPVEPDVDGAAMAVLFMHNEGYSTMCGHATIALGRYAVDRGIVEAIEPQTTFVLQCPCGPVTVYVDVADGQAGMAHFDSVGAFAHTLDATFEVPGLGTVTADLAYGGAFYALVDATSIGLQLGVSTTSDLIAAAQAIESVVVREADLDHPDDEDLAFLYGVILTDGIDGPEPSTNACVFAGSQVDRSPTGSGVTARMAVRHARGQVEIGEERRFASLTDSEMVAKVVGETSVGRHKAVTVRVGGHGYFTGNASFTSESDDPLAGGFLLP